MANHRYWRIYATANNGSSNCSVGELQFRTTAGGADQCTGGTAIESDHGGAYVAANAFDDNTGTFWWTSTARPNWIGYDFGAGNEKDIVEVSMAPRSDGYYYETPGDFKLQYSDNGTDWTDSQGWEGQIWSSATARVFTSGTRRYKIVITHNNASDAGNIAIAEMEIHTSISGSDVCSGGASFGTGQLSDSYAPSKAFDNDTGTMWNQGWVSNCGVGYDFATSQIILEYTVRSRGDGCPGDAPKDWTFQRTTDGLTWTTVGTETNQTSWSAGEVRTFTTTEEAPSSGGDVAPVSVNIGGVWKVGEITAVNIGGIWKEVASVKVNIGGVWKDLA